MKMKRNVKNKLISSIYKHHSLHTDGVAKRDAIQMEIQLFDHVSSFKVVRYRICRFIRCSIL